MVYQEMMRVPPCQEGQFERELIANYQGTGVLLNRNRLGLV
jgi:hypothetical protein